MAKKASLGSTPAIGVGVPAGCPCVGEAVVGAVGIAALVGVAAAVGAASSSGPDPHPAIASSMPATAPAARKVNIPLGRCREFVGVPPLGSSSGGLRRQQHLPGGQATLQLPVGFRGFGQRQIEADVQLQLSRGYPVQHLVGPPQQLLTGGGEVP